jgi:hypothetical protein
MVYICHEIGARPKAVCLEFGVLFYLTHNIQFISQKPSIQHMWLLFHGFISHYKFRLSSKVIIRRLLHWASQRIIKFYNVTFIFIENLSWMSTNLKLKWFLLCHYYIYQLINLHQTINTALNFNTLLLLRFLSIKVILLWFFIVLWKKKVDSYPQVYKRR